LQNPLVRSDENIGMLPCLRQTSIEVPPSLPGYLKLTGLALSKSKHVYGNISIVDYCRDEVASTLLKTETEEKGRGNPAPT